jgi:hypothetical protein
MENEENKPVETTPDNTTEKQPVKENWASEAGRKDAETVKALLPDKEKIPLIVKVEAALKPFNLRYNEISRQAEWLTSRGYEPANIHTLRRHLMHKGCHSFTVNDINSLLQSGYAPICNPYHDYFKGLQWDGQDHIAKLASYVKTNDNKYFEAMLRKNLVRTIDCALNGKVNRYVFTLYSKEENIGKTSWIRALVPAKLSRYFGEGALDGGKDTYLRLATLFIWSLDEISSLSSNRLEAGRLKSIISLSTIVERPPFEAYDKTFKRRVSFYGSTNKNSLIGEESGSTRWLVFSIAKIDFAYSREVNIDQVWAQAYAHYLDKSFNAELTQEETRKQELYNSDYEITFAEKEVISLYLKKCSREEGDFFTNQQLLDYLNQAAALNIQGVGDHYTLNPVRLTTQGLGRALSACGFLDGKRYVNGRQMRGWYVVRVPSPSISEQSEMEFTMKEPAPPQKPVTPPVEVPKDNTQKPSDPNAPLTDVYEGL